MQNQRVTIRSRQSICSRACDDPDHMELPIPNTSNIVAVE